MACHIYTCHNAAEKTVKIITDTYARKKYYNFHDTKLRPGVGISNYTMG
jgi:hypothetical protein